MKAYQPKLLILDADTRFTEQLGRYLIAAGFEVHIEHKSDLGLKKLSNQIYDVILLDLAIPQPSGFAVIKKIREQYDTPILILTAREDLLDEMLCFELGVDDYVQKPCAPLEVIARIRALHKRLKNAPQHAQVITESDIVLDSAARLVTLGGNRLELTNAEFNILEILIKSPNQAFSKEELTEFALGRKHTAYDRSIDVHISNLRNKLGHNQHGEIWIKTLRGFGYLFNKPAS